MNRAAVRYAKAMLSLAQEQNKADALHADLQNVSQAISDSADLQDLLVSKSLPQQVKKAALSQVFEGSDVAVNNLVTVLLQNKRIDLLKDVADAYQDLYQKANGIQEAIVTTAIPIDAAIEAKVLDKVVALTGRKASITNVVNPDIIGGFILRVGDLQYNASVANQLTTIKRELCN